MFSDISSLPPFWIFTYMYTQTHTHTHSHTHTHLHTYTRTPVYMHNHLTGVCYALTTTYVGSIREVMYICRWYWAYLVELYTSA